MMGGVLLIFQQARERVAKLRCSKVLHSLKPVLSVLPIAQRRFVPFAKKLMYIRVSMAIFSISSQLPLYGIQSTIGSDPLYWIRGVLASNRGTVMELGMVPVIIAQLVMQLLVTFKIIRFNKSKEGQAFVNKAQNLLAVMITLGGAVACVLSGMYGNIDELGVQNACLIVIQLVWVGISLMCLDELLRTGYGIGSDISILIAANVGQSFFWRAFSWRSITRNSKGIEVEGALTYLFQVLITRTNKIQLLKDAFFRQNFPNVINVIATITVFLVTIYLHNLQVVLPVRVPSSRPKGHQQHNWVQGSFPIKLLYTSSTPILLRSALVSSIYFISHLLYKSYRIFPIQLLGKWKESWSTYSQVTQLIPIGGLVYYLMPPTSLLGIATDPFHAFFYMFFTIATCAILSKTSMKVSKNSVKDVVTQLKEQQIVMPGHRDSNMQAQLDHYIPIAASFGGVCIGALIVVAEFVVGVGSGTGIVLAAITICQCFDILDKERSSGLDFLGIKTLK